MKTHPMSPSPRAMLLGTALAATVVRGQQSLSYCSSENTGADSNSVTDIYNSYLDCSNHCKASYAFAVMQWQQCWCSNYIPASQASIGSCNQGCPGYPDNKCGNANQGLFGYLALDIAPSGTAGGSSSAQASSTPPSSSQPSSTAEQSTSEPPSTSQTQSVSYVSTTVVQTVTQSPTPSVEVSYSYITPTSSTSTPSPTPSPTTSSTSISTPTTTSTTAPPPVAPVPVATETPTTAVTEIATPVTSVRVITVSGAVVTQFVTSTPIVASPSSSDSQQPLQRKSGLSGGAIAGIVIGVLAALALLALAAFLWRRKRSGDDEASAAGSNKNGVKRNMSVLSKAGLIHRQRPSTGENTDDTWQHGANSTRHSMMFAPGSEVSPVSPLGSSHDDGSRRHSRPFVYDQRLNPSALFANAEANGSRISMQDTQDYSRPLGIANPDLPRNSVDSRVSRHG